MSGFRDSLQFKIPAVFVLAFILVLTAIFGVLSTVGKTLLERQAHEQVRLAVVSAMHTSSQTDNAAALARLVRTAEYQGADMLTLEAIIARAAEEGMRSMFQDGLVKALAGITSIEELVRVTQED